MLSTHCLPAAEHVPTCKAAVLYWKTVSISPEKQGNRELDGQRAGTGRTKLGIGRARLGNPPSRHEETLSSSTCGAGACTSEKERMLKA